MDFSREHTELILDKLHLAMMKKDPHWQDKILSGNHADLQQFHKLQRMCLEQVLRSSEAEMTSEDWKALGEELTELKAVDIAKYALGKAEWLAGKKDRLEAEKADIEQKLQSETSPDVSKDHGSGASPEKVPDKDVSVKTGNGKPDKEQDSESDKETAADDDSTESKAKPDDAAGDDESDKGSEKFKHKDESEDKDKKDKKKKKFPFQKSALALLILKARGTKFLKKIPTGNPKRPFRYLYNEKQVRQYEAEIAAKGHSVHAQIQENKSQAVRDKVQAEKKPTNPVSKKTESHSASTETKHLDPKTDYKVNGTKAKAFKDWFGDWEHAKKTGNYEGVSKVVDSETGHPKEMSSKIVDDEGNPIAVYHGTSAIFDEFKLSEFGKTDQGWYGKGFYFTESEEEAKGYSRVQRMNEKTLHDKVDNTIKLNENWLKTDHRSFSSKKPETLREKVEYAQHLENRRLDELKKTSSHEGYTEWENYSKSRMSSYSNSLNILEGKIKKEDFIKKVYLNIKNPLYIDGTGDQNSKEYNKKVIKQLGDKELAEFSEKETSGIFEKFGAEKFTNLLKSKGYDGVIVFADGLYKRKFHEVVAFDSNQIKHVDNEGTFSKDSNNIYKSPLAILISKAKKRNVGEIWTQPSGRKVKKVKEGMILPVNKHGQVIEKPEKAERKPKQKPEQPKRGRKPADPDKKQSAKKKDQIPKKSEKKSEISGKEEPPKESLSKRAKKGSDAVKAAIDAQKEQQKGGLGTDKIKPAETSKTEKAVKENKKSEGSKQDINDNPTQLNASDIQTIEQYTDKKDYDKEEIEALKNKILENGFDPAYPIMVDKQDGKWTVVAGHHRMEAVKSLIENNQLPADFKVPVISKVFASSNDRLAAQVMENQRRNVLATDEAKAYGKMLKDGWDAQKIAKKIGKKVGQVNKRLALNNLSKDLFTLVSKKDKALPLGVAEVLGMFGVNDDGSPNEGMQIRAFKWYQENRGKLSTSAPVAIQSYIREMKSEGFKGFELENTLSDVQKEALRNVGSAEKAERNSKLIENMLSNLQKSYQRILGDSLSELTPETVNELGSSIAAQGNIHSSKTLGTIDVIIRDLSKIKESFENKIREIQGNANIPLMFSRLGRKKR